MAKLESVKVMMLKGEKGETGSPTDEQVLAQLTKIAEESPEKLVDEKTVDKVTREYLDENPLPIISYEEDGAFELPIHTINDSKEGNDSTWSSNKIIDYITIAIKTATDKLTTSINNVKKGFTNGSVTKLGTKNVGSNLTPIYLAEGKPTALPFKIKVDTKVIRTTIGATSQILFTKDEINSLLGTNYTDIQNFVFCQVMNGDGGARADHIEGCTVLNNGLYVLSNSEGWLATGPLRCNYILIGW